MVRRRVPAIIILILLIWVAVHEAVYWLPGDLEYHPVFGSPVYWSVYAVCAILMAGRGMTCRGGERRGWLLLSASVWAWIAGSMYYNWASTHLQAIPTPSLADVGYVLVYPLMAAGIVELLRATRPRLGATHLIDGVVAALTVAATIAAVTLTSIEGTTGGTFLARLMGLIYPALDATLLGFLACAWSIRGWRPDRTWALLTAGVATFTFSDSAYLVALALGHGAETTGIDPLSPLSLTLIAAAAVWHRPGRRAEPIDVARPSPAPVVMTTVLLGVMVTAAVIHVNRAAIVVTAAAAAAMVVRLVVTLRENATLIRASRLEARTDALTQLGNHRALMQALETRDPAVPATLVLFDLDGFKNYNDRFGHPAGDALLRRLAGKLRGAVEGRGTAYRPGGDEFCVLFDGHVGPEVLQVSVEALSEVGDGFTVAASHGAALLPEEAATGDEAMRLVDQRMYARKHSGRASASTQSRDALLRAVSERMPAMAWHVDRVARLAEQVARALGVDDDTRERVQSTALLHDVGKVAIPDTILAQGTPSDPAEAEFLRSHPVVGERIVGSVPALAHLAPIIRAMHERHDGTGGPDGLAGDAIPLEARIVAACNAYDLLVSGLVAPQRAVATLRTAQTGRFDPRVVEALASMADAGGAPARSTDPQPRRDRISN